MQDPRFGRKSLTTVVATLALAVPFAGVALAGDKGGGNGGGQESAPGQQKKDGAAAQPQPQPPSPPARSQSGKGRGAKPAKPARPAPAKKAKPAKPAPAKRAKPAKPAKPAKQPNPHAKAGKITICHATGSATNPFVEITISRNAVPAHDRHHDGADIIPAPAAGCPKGADKPAAAKDPAAPGHGQKKVTICHATGSATNPYVKITIAEPAVQAHARHQHGEDIIPAPAGDCPAATAAAKGTRTALGAPAPLTLLPAPAAALVAPALAAAPAAGGEASLPRSAVLGEFASGGAAPASAVARETLRRETGAGAPAATGTTGSLPFTGLDAWVLVALGIGALLAGFALRRVAGRRPTA